VVACLRVGARRRPRRAGPTLLRATNVEKINTAVEIGRDADRLRRKKASRKERKRIRSLELTKKVAALRGTRSAADMYRAQKAAADDEDSGEESSGEEPGEKGPPQAYEGEGPARWAWEREDPAASPAAAAGGATAVSENARVVASAELSGELKASARSLIDAAWEYSNKERDHDKAAELYEIARTRVDQEQIERKIDLTTAQQLDDEAMWGLGDAYASGGRLTLAFNTFSILKERYDGLQKKKAQQRWADVAFMLGCALYKARRFQEALDVFVEIHGDSDQTRKQTISESTFEEAQLWTGMTLQQLRRLEDAQTILSDVRRNSSNKQRKAQAAFSLDVVTVQKTMPDERNEVMHEIWDQNFSLPRDSVSQVGMRGSSRAPVLSPREQKWKDWTTQYWEDRLKSPLYYLFLTLFVTWPFAIPIVSIAKQKGGLEYLFQ